MSEELTEVEAVPCPHVAIQASVEIAGLTDAHDVVEGYYAHVRVWCNDCERAFLWRGLEPGLSQQRPMVDVTGEVLNAPLRPGDSSEEFGMGLPGFTVRDRLGQPTMKDQQEMLMRAQGAIANPSTVTPRMFAESAEQWAARAVLKVLELR